MKKREKTDSYDLLPFLITTVVVVVIAVVAIVLALQEEGITMKRFVDNYEAGRYTDPNEQIILIDTIDFEYANVEKTCFWFTSCPRESCPNERICFDDGADGDVIRRFSCGDRVKVTFLVHQKDSLLDESQIELVRK